MGDEQTGREFLLEVQASGSHLSPTEQAFLDSGQEHMTIERDHASARFRMFGGQWIRDIELPMIILATLDDGKEYTYEVRRTFDGLLGCGKVDEAERFAALIYEYLDMSRRADRLLCTAAKHAYEMLPNGD